jgi:fibronectin-binding autotransporter adhesin
MLEFNIGEGALLTVDAILRNDGNSGNGDGNNTGIRKTGIGEMVLTRTNRYFGASEINAGTLTIKGDNRTSNGLVTVNSSGTFKITDGGLINSTVTANAGGFFELAPTTAAISITSAVNGAGAIKKTGSASYNATVSNVGAFTGSFLVDTGTLEVSGTRPTSTSGIGVKSGATLNFGAGNNIALTGTGSSFAGRTGAADTDITGNLSLTGGHTLNIGQASTVSDTFGEIATLTVAGNITVNASTLVFDLVSPSSHDQISATAFAVSGGDKSTLSFNFGDAVSPANGVYDLIAITSGTFDESILEQFQFTGVTSGASLALSSDETVIQLHLSVPATSYYWASSSGTWDNLSSNKGWLDITKLPDESAAFSGFPASVEVVFNASVVTDAGFDAPSTAVSIAAVVSPSSIIIADGSYTFTNTGTGKISDSTDSDADPTALILTGGSLKIASSTGSLANDFTGVVTIGNGRTLELDNTAATSIATIANGGTASLIGAGAVDADALVLNGGTLKFSGSTATTDRAFTVGTNGATIEVAGGRVTFNGTGTVAQAGNAARTLVLASGDTREGVFGLKLSDGTGAATLSVQKTGDGAWWLTNTDNDFTGAVSITGGVLNVTDLDALGGGTQIVLNGGSLGNADTSGTGGADLTIAATVRTVSLGSGTSGWGGFAVAESSEVSVAEAISGTGGELRKSGSGTLTLSGVNTYTGATTVNEGTLKLSTGNSVAASSGVTVANGAVFDISAVTTSATIHGLSTSGTGTGALVSLGDKTLEVNHGGGT